MNKKPEPQREPILDKSFAAFVLSYALSLVAIGIVCEYSGLRWSWLHYEMVEDRPTDVFLGACMIGLIGFTSATGIALGKKWGFVIAQFMMFFAVLAIVSGLVRLVSGKMILADAFVVAYFAIVLLGNWFFCRRTVKAQA